MKKVRLFINYRKEEAWLNKMSENGLSLVEYKKLFSIYTFEKTDSNTYIYKIILLNFPINSNKAKNYISFLSEMELEIFMNSYSNWLYLKKRVDSGSFNIYSDLYSQIRHESHIRNWYVIMLFITNIIELLLIILFTLNPFFIILFAIHTIYQVLLTISLVPLVSKLNKEIELLEAQSESVM